MRIVVVGDGKVGYALTEQLYREGHTITVVDINSALLEKVSGILDVNVVTGNGASMNTLKEAGVPNCDLVIAATSTDELNMVCCLVAKKIGAKRTIARIRNPEYNEQLRTLLQDELGLSMVINPERAAAGEIARLIRYPSAMMVETFARGRIELLAIKVEAGSPLDGLQLVNTSELGAKVLFCAVERGEEVIIPNGKFVLRQGDGVHVTGTPTEILKFLRRIGKLQNRIRDCMIIGGGYIAVYLAEMLDEMGVAVKIIERKPERCALLCEKLPFAMIIQGDGSEQELLEQEGVESVGAFVGLTDFDEENLIGAMYAADRGAGKVIAKINRLNFPNVIARTGINSVVSPKQLTTNQIISFVRGMSGRAEGEGELRTLYQILDGRMEALDFLVRPSTPYLRTPIMQMPLKPNLIIAMILRGGKAILPTGQTQFLVNDTVIVLSKGEPFSSLRDLFTVLP